MKIFEWLFCPLLVMSSYVMADYNIGNPHGSIKVSFKTQDSNKSVELNSSGLIKVLRDNPVQGNVHIDNYKIDIWVFAALQALKSDFVAETKKNADTFETVITEIDGFKNNNKCEWIYSVNGKKSNYFISTQPDKGVDEISFHYSCN